MGGRVRREWIAWLAALALPLAALVVVRLADGLDRTWRRDTAHFWLVLIDAVLAAGFAAASSIDFDESAGAAVMRRQRTLRLGLAALLAAWAAISLIAGSPLAHAIGPERASSELVVIGVHTIAGPSITLPGRSRSKS